MRIFSRILTLAAVLTLPFFCGCRNGVRVARLVVEADGIGHDLKTLNRAVEAEVADPSPRAR